jgi:hypothetical protein
MPCSDGYLQPLKRWWRVVTPDHHGLRHPAHAERYQRTKRRLGKQRGAKVAESKSRAGSRTPLLLRV